MAGLWTAIFIVIIIFLLRKIYEKVRTLLETPPVPHLEDTWWGSRQEYEEDTEIKPFAIHVPDEVLEDLHHRLNNARPLTPPLEGIEHQYGFNTKLLTEILDYWCTSYDWRLSESYLNSIPQYTVSVQGLNIHFLHSKPTETQDLEVIPLFLLHGWPGSVREFYEIIPLLTTPRPGFKFVFEVIAPSLPGYGFSEAAARPGLGAAEMAVLFKNFMRRLGFDKYYVQGGDWGAYVVQNMAAMYPEHVLGVHSNYCFVNSLSSYLKTLVFSLWPSLFMDKRFQERLYPLGEKFANRVLESGYAHLQATKPDTVGVALNDSPIGLAAYILEKFITWTNPNGIIQFDGALPDKFSYTSLLDNIMIYWVTNSMTTAMRLYAETLNKKQRALGFQNVPITVPCAVSRFTYEMAYFPTSLLREKYRNIVHESDLEGGHFAAFEVPEVLADDIFKGIEKMELYYTHLLPLS